MSNSASISQLIADTLRSEILRGQYREGERLPSERDLSTRFEASRGAVREALKDLSQTGLIDILPGGVRVQDLRAARLSILGPLLALDPIPDPLLVDQFMQIFGMLAALSAKNAVEKASPEQYEILNDLMEQLAQQPRDFASMQPHWQALVEYMGTIDDNLVVNLIGNDLKAQFVSHMNTIGLEPNLGVTAGIEFINTMQLALSERDGFQASEAIRRHFDHLRSNVIDTIREAKSQSEAGAQAVV